jgi:hypothetical protein
MEVIMRFLFPLCVLMCAVLLSVSAQEVATHLKVMPVPEEFLPVTNPEWGNDVAITNREPLANPTGAARSSGVAYVAVPDTGLIANRGIVLYKTTNFGATWSTLSSVQPSFIVTKQKMVRASNDSLYLFILTSSFGSGRLYYWNVETGTIRTFDSTNIRDFDVATSSQGGMYLFYDYHPNDRIFRAASSDFGATWPQRATITSAGAFPRAFLNAQYSGLDTLILNYFSPVKPDTLRSVIRQALYREVAAGNLAPVAFIDVDVDTTVYRGEYRSVKMDNVVWFFNTRGSTGAIDIQCRVSTNSGVSFDAPFLAAGNPAIDEYWFDVTNYTISPGGVDFIYYADSLGSTVDNNTDKVMYAFLRKSTPTTVSGRTRISDHPLTWSPRNYIPSIFEYYDVDADLGVLWVGLDGVQRKVYYDNYNATPTSVEPTVGDVPMVYALKQNYPNPFNPSTTIEFAIPQNGFVTLKVYDLLGREVQTLVSANLTAGTYRTRFDAGKLASGVYVYRLQAGNFTDARKLMIVK